MPHIILEHSSNLKIDSYQNIFTEIYSILEKNVDANPKRCKGRVRIAENYFIGLGEKDNKFLHLDINLLSGRTSEAKQECGKHLADKLKELTKELENLQITVKLTDMPKEFYFKA